MSAYREAVQRHFHNSPYKFVIQHFGPNRAQRRRQGYRHKKTKKLIVEPSRNMQVDVYLALHGGDDDA